MQKIGSHRAGAVMAVLVAVYANVSGAAPGTVTYTYDDLGRLRSSSYSDGRLADYQYDAAGNRTSNAAGGAPTLTIAAPTGPAAEGASLVFTVTRTGLSPGAITVTCVQSDGTAKSGGTAPFDDYTPLPQVITFLPGEPSPATRPCAVTTKDDSFYEGGQTFTASLQNATAGVTVATSSAVATIADNDPAPVLSVEGASKGENVSPLTFTVTKAGLTELDHNVTYATEDGTASTSDSDYSAVSGKYTFPAATTSYALNVPIINDTRFEPNETVAMRLSAPLNGATLGTSLAFSTITNDDQPPSLTINDPAAVSEGAAVTFTVTKSGSSSFAHSVNWSTANGTAVQPGDYTAASGVITFAPAEVTKTFQVQTNSDALAEAGSETFFANLTSNAGTNAATIADAQGIGTINDNDPVPTIAISDAASVNEGGISTFTVTKTGNSTQSHSVTWATANNTAIQPGDYTSATGTLTFAVGESSKTIQVQTRTDGLWEGGNETYVVNLTTNQGTNGASISDGQGLAAIIDIDAPPSITISDAATVNEGGVSTFTVTKTGNSTQSHSVSWSTANNTAIQPGDYTAATGTVTFAVGESSKTIQVQTRTDGLAEGGNETYFVNLATNGSTNGASISDGQGIGTIADIDNAAPTVPGNLRVSPTGNSPNYSVLWNASTGGVAYYLLEETYNNNVGAPFNTTSTSRAYSAKPSGDYEYRVRACNSSNVCSAYSAKVIRLVCNGTCQ